jgi:hypothetical protein
MKWCNLCHSIGNEEPKQEDARPHDFTPDFPRPTDTDKFELIAYIRSLADG